MTDIEIMKEYLLLKLRLNDFHAVADCAMDLREMVARDEQRKEALTTGAERDLSKDEELAYSSKKPSGTAGPSQQLAGTRTKKGLGGELGAKTDEIDRDPSHQRGGPYFTYAGLCDCAVCQTKRTQSVLDPLRADPSRV